ncbi:MAG: helix-turn-helix transcriptional regulator [Pseudonocardia sp.]|nr:helix-turn-helix transcriptional regulator [Pseudonocardia sp.]
MPASRADAERPSWAETLRSLRIDAGLTQPQAAAAANRVLAPDSAITQQVVSRTEQGGQLPDTDVISALCKAYGATPQASEAIQRALETARKRRTDRRLVVQRGNTVHAQQRWRRIEGAAQRVDAIQTGMVLGLLQTPAYAALAMQVPEDHPAIADRRKRFESMLSDTDRQYRLVQTEGSLRVQLGSPELMADQLDALRAAAEVPYVDLRVLPMSSAVTEPLTSGGFHIYDDVVVLGLDVGAADIDDPDDVAYFRQLFEQYHRPALAGSAASELLSKLAEQYRGIAAQQ